MSRSRKSARDAGAKFEREIADYLAQQLDDDRIERRARNGAKDRGDVGGVRHRGERVVIEAKNSVRADLSGWAREAHLEAGHDDAAVGVVAHKRHGTADPARQWITMTLADLAWLLGGDAPEYDE